MSTTRRQFICIVPCASLALAAPAAFAQPAKLSDKDPTAVALGYVEDATKADKAKYPKYAAGQHCANCSLYQGAATAPMAPCAIFAGKQVAGAGWCSAWAKKA